MGKPDAGNLHVRFDEEGSGCLRTPSFTLLVHKNRLSSVLSISFGVSVNFRNAIVTYLIAGVIINGCGVNIGKHLS